MPRSDASGGRSPRRKKARRATGKRLLPYVQARLMADGEWKYRCHYPSPGGGRKWGPWVDSEEQAHEQGKLEREVLKRPGKTITLGAAMELVRRNLELTGRAMGSLDWYEGQFRVIAKHWGLESRLDKFTADEIEAFIRKRQADGVTNGTIKGHKRAINRLYSIAIKKGYRLFNPVPGSPDLADDPEPPHQPVFQWEVAVQRIATVRQVDEAVADIMALHLYTGIRRSEAARILRQHIEPDILTIASKGGRRMRRVLPMPPQLQEVVRRILARNTEGAPGLLPGATERLRIGANQRAFNKAKKITGDQDVGSHAFRRTFTSELSRKRVADRVIAQLTSHARQGRSMLERYTTVWNEDLRAAMECLWEGHQEPPTSPSA